MSTTPIGNSDYLRVWDNTGNNLNPSPSNSIIDNGFLPDTKTDSSILNYAINILGQKVNQSLAYGSPQWSPNNAYKIGSTVNNSGNVYISKIDNNLNKVPYANQDSWDLVATSYSPNFTGIPTAPTASSGTNTTQLATTAFVKNTVSNIPRATVSVAGIVQLSLESQVNEGTDNTTAITPLKLSNFVNTGTLSQTGWRKIGSIIIQWGYVPTTPISQRFPITFPNAVFSALVTPIADGIRSGNISNLTKTEIAIICGEGGATSQNYPAYWFAIGY